MTPPAREPRVSLPDTVPVVRPGRGPLLAVVLVVAAFAVGLVRPWDWLATSAPGARADPSAAADGSGAGRAGPGAGEASSDAGPSADDGSSADPAAEGSPSTTCASPLGWRAATIESWSGRQAHVWTAADAVAASGPADPGIPFRPIVAETVSAIGWCAPVVGGERPPLAATATLFRVRDGAAVAIPYDRLEPSAPNALGELIVPPAPATGSRPPWAPGRYVIRLAAPGGSYVRYLGMEVMRALPASTGADPATSPSASPTAAPPIDPSPASGASPAG